MFAFYINHVSTVVSVEMLESTIIAAYAILFLTGLESIVMRKLTIAYQINAKMGSVLMELTRIPVPAMPIGKENSVI